MKQMMIIKNKIKQMMMIMVIKGNKDYKEDDNKVNESVGYRKLYE